jgi:predicted MFS family arabinose efflux permease
MIRISGWQSPFWLLGGIVAAGAMLIGRLLDRDTGDVHGDDGRLRLDWPSGAFLITAGLYALAAQLMFVVLGAWLEDSFGLSLVEVGGIAVLVGLAELAGEGATAGFADRVGKRRSVFAGITIAALGFALFAAVHGSLIGGVAAAMIAYFGFELAIVSGVPYASEIHPHARARFLAWMVVGWAVGRTLGSALGPRLYLGSGIAIAALVAAALNVLAVLVLAWGGVPENVIERRSVPDSAENHGKAKHGRT